MKGRVCLTDCELQNNYLYVLIPMKSYVKIHVKRKLVYVVVSNNDAVLAQADRRHCYSLFSQYNGSSRSIGVIKIHFSSGQQN